MTKIDPMTVKDTAKHVERLYRQTDDLQWVREIAVNSFQAGASRVHFGIEWEAVEQLGIYRRMIADDGEGMSPEGLVEFFNSYGGSGRSLEDAVHGNFGIGSKISLAWCELGVVVLSWRDGKGSMIRMLKDEVGGERGLKRFDLAGGGEASVVELHDEVGEVDWRKVKPDWIDQHGTVLVLCGSEKQKETVLGDPRNPEVEAQTIAISKYLNSRFFRMPSGCEVKVDELSGPRAKWPKSRPESRTMAGRGFRGRTVKGAEALIDSGDDLAASGVVDLEVDGVKVHWFIQKKKPVSGSHKGIGTIGSIGTIYQDELFDNSSHSARATMFGLWNQARQRIWLVVEPPSSEEDRPRKTGVFPTAARDCLKWHGGAKQGNDMPLRDWAEAFCARMPQEIDDALKEEHQAKSSGKIDNERVQRMIEKYGARFEANRKRARSRLRQDPSGAEAVAAALGGELPRGAAGDDEREAPKPRARRRRPKTDGEAGNQPARRVKIKEESQPPKVIWMPAEEIWGAQEIAQGDGEKFAVSYAPPTPAYPGGLVRMNQEHHLFLTEIEFFASERPASMDQLVIDKVKDVYGLMAIAKIIHIEDFRGVAGEKQLVEWRSDASLTVSLMGVIGASERIESELGSLGGYKPPKKRAKKPRRKQPPKAA